MGRFNVHNALAAVTVGEVLGLDPAAVRGPRVRGRRPGPDGAPGRGQPFGVVIDYAHSPASLEKVLGLLAPLAAARGGELIAVFGSAGERDVEKRRMMGRIAGAVARLVVATDEDPRGEDRDAILDEIARGARTPAADGTATCCSSADRPAAIAAAFERARPGDIVLLAGKGHEQSIIGPDGPIPYDERSTAEATLAAIGYAEDPAAPGGG